MQGVPVLRVAAIHDLSGFGRASLTVAIPILATMGIQVCPLPTAVLSSQTSGVDDFTFLDLTSQMSPIMDHWARMGLRFDAVYSGFLGSPDQSWLAGRCIREFRAPGGIAVVDPVLGDNGRLDPTQTPEMVEAMRRLVGQADIITPNLTEACMLAGVGYGEFISGLTEENFYDAHYALAEKCAAVCKGGRAVITGVTRDEGLRYVYNFAVSEEGGFFTKNRMYGGHYSGTGDITASIITGCLMSGRKLSESVGTAADFVEAAVRYSFHHDVDKNDGVANAYPVGINTNSAARKMPRGFFFDGCGFLC